MTGSTKLMRVLLATDDSAPARIAESWVTRLRWMQTPIVDVVCVAGRGMKRFGWGLAADRATVREAVESIRQAELMAAERIANEVGERLQDAGMTVHVWALQGDCGDQILAMTDDQQPDLVVLGPRGRSGLAQAILGSVTQQVVAGSAAPVLVARPAQTPDGDLPARTLILMDGTPAECSVTWLLRSGWLNGSSVVVVGLLGQRAGLGDDEPELIEELARTIRDDARAALDDLVAPLVDAGVDVDLELRDGHPLRASLEAIEALAPDLVVVVHPARRRGQDQFAEKVARHTATSVLVVPTG